MRSPQFRYRLPDYLHCCLGQQRVHYGSGGVGSLLLRVIKLVQTRTEIEQGKAYVMCAVASGARPRRILFVHILPNLVWDVLHFICLPARI